MISTTDTGTTNSQQVLEFGFIAQLEAYLILRDHPVCVRNKSKLQYLWICCTGTTKQQLKQPLLTLTVGASLIINTPGEFYGRRRWHRRCISLYTVSQKNRANFETVYLEIIRADFDDISQKYSKYSRIESACFRFRIDLLFYQLFVFQTGHRK